jgi:hypothetical protein
MRRSWVRLLPVVALALPASVHATIYLSVDQAQSAMFPHQRLTPAFRQLQAGEIAAIKQASGVAPQSKQLQAWRAQDGGWFIVDRVIGKHEFITYAVALTRFGSPLQLGKDIKNISGATLSSRHVTDGVRRLIATWQIVLRNG